jgi:hypothetical protein
VSAVDVIALLAPMLALLCALLLGRYPGERALRRRLVRSRGPRGPKALARTPRRPARSRLPRGGALLAHSLAGRAPPSGSA